MVGLVTNLLLFWYKKNCLFLEFRRTKQMSSLFEDVSSCQKKYKTLHCIKKTTVYENRTHRILFISVWIRVCFEFQALRKKTRYNSFFSDIHSKVLRSVRITFFVLHLSFFWLLFFCIVAKLFWADSKINDAKFNQNKKHYLDVTPKRLLIPNCLFFVSSNSVLQFFSFY